MKIAIGSAEIIDFKKDVNLQNITTLLLKAKQGGAEYLFLGEAVLNGFSGLEWNYENDLRNNSDSMDSDYIIRVREICNTHKTGFGFGYFEKEKDTIFSSYLIIDKNGTIIENYRRMSKGWKKPDLNNTHYAEGNTLSLIHLGNSKCTVSICGDMWTDEIIEQLKQHESDTIIWPLYIDYSLEEWENSARNEYLLQVKNIGKRTLLINSISNTPKGANGGLIDISSDGTVISEAKMRNSDILYASL